MDKIFTPVKIGGLEIKNRLLMSAAVDGLADDSVARAKRHAELAAGGIGLIVAGRVMKAEEDFGRVADAVHEAGGKIALQLLSHKGLGFGDGSHGFSAGIVSRDSEIFTDFFPYSDHREASRAEMENFPEDFARAARMAMCFGVDAVEVHSAHHSALMQILSPLINNRNDEWGGSIENRIRMHKAVYDVIRSEVGREMPIFIKLGVADPYEDGLKIEEGKIAARLLAEHGYDAIEVSQGLQDFRDMKTLRGTPIRMNTVKISDEAYYRDLCIEVKRLVSKPVIMTGGIRSYELAEEILANGEADMIGMCRPFICEPDLPNRWQNGNHKKSKCISCNKCCIGMMKHHPLACHIKEKWSF